MMGKSYAVLVILLCCVVAFSLLALTRNSCADYPWVHYFERPDMPDIHCAFADKEGNVIVSTGDWNDTYYNWPYIVYRYWSEGLYRINCEAIERIECPANTFVLDSGVDSQGTTWLLIADGVDGYVDAGGLAHSVDAESLDSTVGYRGVGLYLRNYRFARLEGATVIEDEELTEAVPTKPVAMCSDRWGRVYVFSWRWSESKDIGDRNSFVSWWAGGHPIDVHVCEISNMFPGANMDCYAGRYPEVGPDGLAYFRVGNAWDYVASTEYAVLCLDPEAERWELYDEQDSPLLGCAIRYFRVDPMNIKWFGTEDGLVRFDGESWTRFAQDNTDLPHDLVRQIEYDDVDHVYYVVTQTEPNVYQTAFSVLSPGGRLVGGPLRSPERGYPWSLPKVYKDARGIWWLLLPYNYRATTPYDVYAYDHRQVFRWDTGIWFNRPDAYIGSIGSDALGRTFCAGPTCVMIW